MTTISTTPTAGPAGAAAALMTPKAFVRELRRLMKTGSPWDVAAFYEEHGPGVAPLLRGRDRVVVGDIMHVVDAATGWTPTPEMLRPPGGGA